MRPMFGIGDTSQVTWAEVGGGRGSGWVGVVTSMEGEGRWGNGRGRSKIMFTCFYTVIPTPWKHKLPIGIGDNPE